MQESEKNLCVITINSELNILFYNEHASLYVDLNQVEILKSLKKTFNANQCKKLGSLLNKAFDSKKPYYEQITNQKKSYIISIDPLSDFVGNIVQVNITIQEYQGNFETNLDKEFYNLISQSTRDGFWDWPDMDQDEEYWSPQWKKLLGYEDHEIQASASKFFEMLHPDDVQLTQTILEKHMKGEAPFDLEYRLKTKSGKYKWFRAKGIVSRNSETGKSRMSGCITDIQEYKDAANNLRESEYIKKSFIESSYDGYWDWHIQDDYEYMSPRFWEMFGYEPSEKEHHPSEWQKLITEDSLKIALDNFDKHIKTKGKHPFWQEVEYIHKDGHSVYVICKGKVIEWDKDGAPVRMIGTHTDITELQKSRNELIEANRALERINEEVNTFSYIASHDLKEPIRGLCHNASLLKKYLFEQNEENLLKRIDRIIYLSKRMEKLVNDVLHFTNIRNCDLHFTECDLNIVIQEITNLLENTIRREKVNILIPKKLPTIKCDEFTISEIFRNLIANAIKYNLGKNKIVEIGFKKDADMEGHKYDLLFYVKDNGIGIQKEYHKEIFKLFKRLNVEDENVKGTGVGLTFVYKMIEKYKGKIWVDSKENKGSTFYFYIPSTTNL